jgi:hypothetical protein
MRVRGMTMWTSAPSPHIRIQHWIPMSWGRHHENNCTRPTTRQHFGLEWGGSYFHESHLPPDLSLVKTQCFRWASAPLWAKEIALPSAASQSLSTASLSVPLSTLRTCACAELLELAAKATEASVRWLPKMAWSSRPALVGWFHNTPLSFFHRRESHFLYLCIVSVNSLSFKSLFWCCLSLHSFSEPVEISPIQKRKPTTTLFR